MAVIVAGTMSVDPRDRDRFVEGYRELMEAARGHPGCLGTYVSADPIEPGRVNLFEHWESHEALDAFRAVAPTPTGEFDVRDLHVLKHEISHSGAPFD